MTTLSEMQVQVARDLQDPASHTFGTTDLTDLINSALAEVGRIAPRRFQEDLDVLADTIEYPVQSDFFSGVGVPELEVLRVEVWDGSLIPPRFVTRVPSATETPSWTHDAGWRLWNGTLSLPGYVQRGLVADQHIIRVWGYSPYAQVADGADVIDVSTEQYWAVRTYCRVLALERLLGSRDLYTQWQTRTGNTDVSPASLMNQLSLERDNWRRRKRELAILREA